MTQPDIIVEFIGLPGSGKSTLSARLAARLAPDFDADLPDRSAYRSRTLSFVEKLRLDAAYAPGCLPYRLGRLLYDVQTSGIGLWTVANSWERSRYPLVFLDRAARMPRRLHLLDEWLMHRTIDESIRRYRSNIDFSRRFAIYTATQHRSVYVCINVDRALAQQRVLAQHQPFRLFAKEKDGGKINEVLGLWLHQLEALKLEIYKRGLLLIEVDGSAPIESNVETLHERLKRLANGGG